MWRRLAPSLDRTDVALMLLTVGLKLGVLVLGMLAVLATDGRLPHLLEPWHRWDAPHYTDLAVFGYRASDPGTLVGPAGYEQVYPGDLDLYIVFYPLFPWLVDAARTVLVDPVLAAWVVAGVASLSVGPLLRRVVAAELGERRGIRAAAFLLIFPTAYFLHIGYTESLFLALALGAFLAARANRWAAAGVLAGFATLARVNGLLLVPALAVEVWLAWRADPERRLRPAWALAVAGPLVGFAGYLALNWRVYGDPVAFVEIQREHWFKSLTAPWDGIGGVIGSLGDPDPQLALMYGWAELAFIGLGLAATAYAIARFRPSWAAWMAGNWLLFVSTGFVLSVPRYTLVMFPLVAWFAVLADRRPLRLAIAALSLLLLGIFAWRFASGDWAF